MCEGAELSMAVMQEGQGGRVNRGVGQGRGSDDSGSCGGGGGLRMVGEW